MNICFCLSIQHKLSDAHLYLFSLKSFSSAPEHFFLILDNFLILLIKLLLHWFFFSNVITWQLKVCFAAATSLQYLDLIITSKIYPKTTSYPVIKELLHLRMSLQKLKGVPAKAGEKSLLSWAAESRLRHSASGAASNLLFQLHWLCRRSRAVRDLSKACYYISRHIKYGCLSRDPTAR